MKTCSRCNESRPLEDFPRFSSLFWGEQYPDGYAKTCIQCRKETARNIALPEVPTFEDVLGTLCSNDLFWYPDCSMKHHIEEGKPTVLFLRARLDVAKDFWSMWKVNRDHLRSLGFQPYKDEEYGGWMVKVRVEVFSSEELNAFGRDWDVLRRTYRKERTKRLRGANSRKRRAREVEAEGSHTVEDIRCLYEQQERCICGKPLEEGYTIEHIQPLCRGGSDYPENLMLMCLPCNQQKLKKTWMEYFFYLIQKRSYKKAARYRATLTILHKTERNRISMRIEIPDSLTELVSTSCL